MKSPRNEDVLSLILRAVVVDSAGQRIGAPEIGIVSIYYKDASPFLYLNYIPETLIVVYRQFRFLKAVYRNQVLATVLNVPARRFGPAPAKSQQQTNHTQTDMPDTHYRTPT